MSYYPLKFYNNKNSRLTRKSKISYQTTKYGQIVDGTSNNFIQLSNQEAEQAQEEQVGEEVEDTLSNINNINYDNNQRRSSKNLESIGDLYDIPLSSTSRQSINQSSRRSQRESIDQPERQSRRQSLVQSGRQSIMQSGRQSRRQSRRMSDIDLRWLFDTREMVAENHISNTSLQNIQEDELQQQLQQQQQEQGLLQARRSLSSISEIEPSVQQPKIMTPVTPVSVGVPRRYTMNVTPRLRQKYRILRQLGQGAYGRVLLGETRENPPQRVAIKMVSLIDADNPTAGINDSILSEVSILRRLNHPNIIKLYDTDYDAEQQVLALVLELAQTDLKHLIDDVWFSKNTSLRTRATEQIPQQLQIAYDIFCGLNYLHQNGIIHLDLKPQNILIVNENGRLHAKIADFGISDRADGYKLPGYMKVTWGYRAPELECGEKYDYNADTWSLGIILGEIFFNRHLIMDNIPHNVEIDDLFKYIVKNIGIPSQKWSQKYVQSRYRCPRSLNAQENQDTYKDIELSLLEAKENYYKNIYYQPTLYQEIFDLMSQCLRFEPSERIQFQQVVQLNMFQNQPCNCEKCLIVAVEHVNFDIAPPLSKRLEEVVPGNGEILLKYAREIYLRLLVLVPDFIHESMNEQIKYQAACLSIAGKFLNVDIDDFQHLRAQWIERAKLTASELNKLEIEVADTLNFNFDGPFTNNNLLYGRLQ